MAVFFNEAEVQLRAIALVNFEIIARITARQTAEQAVPSDLGDY